MIVAAIDIGTNTLRLLVAEATTGAFREIHSDRKITRLGQDLDRTGLLSAEARERSLAILGEYSRSIARHQAARFAAVGTSALRNASNTPEFIAAVAEKTGMEIRVISGEEEARLTLLGVMKAVNCRCGPVLVADIGGGSTELIYSDHGGHANGKSLPLGAVYLTERFLKGDPPATGDQEELRRAVRNELAGQLRPGEAASSATLVGTAGTVTTLAAMDMQLADYDPVRINGYTLTLQAISRLVGLLSRTTIKERLGLPGLEQGREDIILAGAIVSQEIMTFFGFEQMLVSDWGLREGIIFDLYE